MISSRLRQLLDKKGITAAELARRAGLAKQTVQFILDGTSSGENVRAGTIEAIAKELDSTWSYLLHGIGHPTTDVPEERIQHILAAYLSLPPHAKETIERTIETFARLSESGASYKL